MKLSLSSLSRRGFLTASGTVGSSVVVGSVKSTTESVTGGTEPKWTTNPPNSHYFRPVSITRGTVFAAGFSDHDPIEGQKGLVYALDVVSGEIRWSFDAPTPLLPRDVVDGTLYVIADTDTDERSDQWNLIAINAATGKELWRESVISTNFPLPRIEDGTVFLPHDSGLVAIDAVSGNRAWTFATDDERFAHPVPAGETVYVSAREGVYALSSEKGTESWWINPQESHRGFVRVADDEHAYYITRSQIYALSTSDGRIAWSSSVSGYGEPILDEESLYLWDESRLRAIDIRDGTTRWTYGEAGSGGVSPVVTDGAFFVKTAEGVFHAVNLDDGSKRWSREFAGRGRMHWWGDVKDDVAYVIGYDGFYALSTDDGSIRWTYETSEEMTSAVVGEKHVVLGSKKALYGFDHAKSALATFVDETAGFLTSGTGLALSGILVGTGAMAVYRQLNETAEPTAIEADSDAESDIEPDSDIEAATEPEPELEYGRLEVLDADEVTETCRVRRRTDDGPRTVIEKRLTDPSLSEQFQTAIERWADLSDRRGVVPVLDHSDEWVELPDCEDGSLAGCNKSLEKRIDALSAANMTVHRAHQDGIVHGGLTPASILLDDDTARVSDWELGSMLTEHRSPSPFDAPEQITGGTVDERTDVYRLGAIAATVIAGDESDETPTTEIDVDRSPELAAVLSKAMADDPDDRYQSVVKFDDMLRWAMFRV
ncbi:outer membrane protein assembly factor BamB family protein [Haladaptatus sp. NG-SE-30]